MIQYGELELQNIPGYSLDLIWRGNASMGLFYHRRPNRNGDDLPGTVCFGGLRPGRRLLVTVATVL